MKKIDFSGGIQIAQNHSAMELHNNSILFYITSDTHSQTWSVTERFEFDGHVPHTLGTIGCGLLLGTLFNSQLCT